MYRLPPANRACCKTSAIRVEIGIPGTFSGILKKQNKHILFSEVLGEARMVAEQRGINPQKSPLLFQSVFDSILKEKINLNVVLVYVCFLWFYLYFYQVLLVQ